MGLGGEEELDRRGEEEEERRGRGGKGRSRRGGGKGRRRRGRGGEGWRWRMEEGGVEGKRKGCELYFLGLELQHDISE